MHEKDFRAFKTQFKNTFDSLHYLQKIDIIDLIISLCKTKELSYLFTQLDILQKRDFIRFLPVEVVQMILSFLDCKSLFVCCLVSKEWDAKISACDLVWQRASFELGRENKQGYLTWKNAFVATKKTLKQIRNQNNVKFHSLRAHVAKVCAVNCNYGSKKIATGSMDGKVCLWDLETSCLLKEITTHSCAAIQFNDEFLFTGSYDNTINCLKWSDASLVGRYVAHTGAVFSLSYYNSKDLLLSGASDSSVCLWKASTFELLACMTGHTGWVSQVLLHPACVTSLHHTLGDIVTLSCDKIDIRVWTHGSKEECVVLGKSFAPLTPNKQLQQMMFDGMRIMGSCKECIFVWNFADYSLIRQISKNPSSLCIGLGLNWILCLEKQALQLLAVLPQKQIQTSKLLVEWKCPHFFTLKHGINYSTGSLAWLDGDLPTHKQVLFAIGTSSNEVFLLTWDAIK